MFFDSHVMVLLNNKDWEVRKIPLALDIQGQIISWFSECLEKYLISSTKTKPWTWENRIESQASQAEQIYSISNYRLPDTVYDSLAQPDPIEILNLYEEQLPKIKNIFLGTLEPEPLVAFQNFTISQYLSSKSLSIFPQDANFFQPKGVGLRIDKRVDCVYNRNNILFKSFWTARQTLDLAKYYKEATEGDVMAFLEHPHLHFTEKESAYQSLDSWMRRKIALLTNSQILDRYPITDIVNQADNHGISLEITQSDDKPQIVISNNNEDLRILLQFLGEDIYKGPLTNNIYLAGSKKHLVRNLTG